MSDNRGGHSKTDLGGTSIESLLVTYLARVIDGNSLRYYSYLPFIQALTDVRSGVRASDLQAGSGDWLYSLQRRGVIAHGAEARKPLFSICASRGLSVLNTDWLSYIRSLESESQDVVSCFELLDRLSLNDVELLMLEARRVLTPGGLLICELQYRDGQNAALKSADSVHLDPEFLTFALKDYGFARTTLTAIESEQLVANADDLSLEKVLLGWPTRYALVSQKTGYKGDQKKIDRLFFEEKVDRYEDAIKRFDKALVGFVRDANEKARMYDAVIASTSWRVTAPFRKTITMLNYTLRKVRSIRLKMSILPQEFRTHSLNRISKNQFAKTIMAHADAYVMRRPKLLALLSRGLQVLPEGLRLRIKRGLSFHRVHDAVKIRAYQRSERGRFIFRTLVASIRTTSQNAKAP